MNTVSESMLKKIKTRGLYWFLTRLLQESERKISTSLLFKLIMSFLYWSLLYPLNKSKRFGHQKKMLNKDILYVFYDLEVAPVTFDFAWTLVLGELERNKRGLEKIHVVFVPGKHEGFREETVDYAECIDVIARYWRRDAILYPLCYLLESCGGVTYCASRGEAFYLCEKMRPAVFPIRYSTTFPITHSIDQLLQSNAYDMMPLQASVQSKRYIQQWINERLGNRKLITITLRCSSYMTARNSNLLAWVEFVKQLDNTVYLAIFLPDTETALETLPKELSNHVVFTEPCWNLNLRVALYEASYLNLGVNNGAMILCWLNARCRYLTFKMLVPEAPQTTEAAFKKHGFAVGQSLPFAGSFQKWVWENDDADVIAREFTNMCQLIDSNLSV